MSNNAVYVVLYWHEDLGPSVVDSVFEDHGKAKEYIKQEMLNNLADINDDFLSLVIQESKVFIKDGMGDECESMTITKAFIR